MVYLDNAATTYPKPPSVISKSSYSMINYGANPGRAGHKLSAVTAEAVYLAREKCADFFGAEAQNVCFVLNCTQALNMAIKGIFSKGAHYVTSDLEHNAVIRPLFSLAKNGGDFSVARVKEKTEDTLREFERRITHHTKAVVVTCASNVTGQKLPIREIGEICKKKRICFIVDAAQGAGVIPLDLRRDNINILCVAGHKGLYGPMGTGLLITDGKYQLRTFFEGGTGSVSKQLEQPLFLPDRFESGTINTSGVIALGAGIDFVSSKGIDTIFTHEWELCRYVFDSLKKERSVLLYSDSFKESFVPLFPFNVKGMTSEGLASELSVKGFCLRGGFHCAPFAHKKIGTYETGAVRFAPSVFTTRNEAESFLRAVRKIISGR